MKTQEELKLFIVQDEQHQYLCQAAILASNLEQALGFARERGYRLPAVHKTYDLTPGLKTEFVE